TDRAQWHERAAEQCEREVVVAVGGLGPSEVQLAHSYTEPVPGRTPDPPRLLQRRSGLVDAPEVAEDFTHVAQGERGAVHVSRLVGDEARTLVQPERLVPAAGLVRGERKVAQDARLAHEVVQLLVDP